jgi:pyruvate kinase
MDCGKRTKIVATIGPASGNAAILEKLVLAGVNVFRLNFSHGDHNSHALHLKNIKKIRKDLGLPVSILQDLSGPKIRVGKISPEPLELKVNDHIIFDSDLKGQNDDNIISINYRFFAKDVFPGARLLLSDGEMEVIVDEIKGNRVVCKVINGGLLTSSKGINFPSGSFNLPSITDKDCLDLKFGLQNGIDLVALSFVRSSSDIKHVQELMEEEGRVVPIIAKIEKHEAINNIEEILETADGIMIARGDLGVEVDMELIPIIQKQILLMANQKGKPVITATQMLRSMVSSPRPTRAEVTDVANAIIDGTDAIMLSEETAIGKFPVATVQIMSKIAVRAEEYYLNKKFPLRRGDLAGNNLTTSIAHSAVILSNEINARIIFAITRTGYTAKAIARYRPSSTILALTPSINTYYQLNMVWGVIPELSKLTKNSQELFNKAFELAKKRNFLQKNDSYVIVSGFPLGEPGTINQIKAGQFV